MADEMTMCGQAAAVEQKTTGVTQVSRPHFPSRLFAIGAALVAEVVVLGTTNASVLPAQDDDLLRQDIGETFHSRVAFSSQCIAGDELRVLAFPVGLSTGRFFVWRVSLADVSLLSSISIDGDSKLSIDEAMGGVASVGFIRAQIDSLASQGFLLMSIERVEDFVVSKPRECTTE